ncbi:MAG: alkaline serine protease, partial [Myxococcota bacterium]
GGYYVRAWDACGREAEGFPKFTGGWITSSVALGDIDGDGLIEAVVSTRNGYLFAWNTNGPADGVHPWPEYRHDNHNTGNYDAPLSYGEFKMASEPLVCEVETPPDGGTDGGADAGPRTGGTAGGGGCDCHAGGEAPIFPWALTAFGAWFLWVRRRGR